MIPTGLLLAAGIVVALFVEANWCGRTAMYLGLSPSAWGLYGLLVPGISVAHLLLRQRRLPAGAGILCRMRLTDPPRFSPIISSTNVRYELDFGDGITLGAVPVDRRAPSGLEQYLKDGNFECIWWCWDGDRVRANIASGSAFSVGDLARGGKSSGSHGIARGEVSSVLPAVSWRATKGHLSKAADLKDSR